MEVVLIQLRPPPVLAALDVLDRDECRPEAVTMGDDGPTIQFASRGTAANAASRLVMLGYAFSVAFEE